MYLVNSLTHSSPPPPPPERLSVEMLLPLVSVVVIVA